MAKAGRDTFFLMAGPDLSPTVNGTFQDLGGSPNWNGWTTLDWTVSDSTSANWHVSDYYAIDGVYSAYCGDETLPSCGGGDPEGGYGTSWDKILRWNGTVANNQLPTNLNVTFDYDVDSEEGFDYAQFARELANDEREELWQLSGDSTGTVTIPVTYAPGDYFGEFGDE